jgi:hypothetical protein
VDFGHLEELEDYLGWLANPPAGHPWHGGRNLDRTLQTLWWEATRVAKTLGFGPTCTSTQCCASMSPAFPGWANS